MVINQGFVPLCRGEGSNVLLPDSRVTSVSFCGLMRERGFKKMALEIKEDMKVVRRNIHLTCMTVLIDVSGHEFHITQQGWALASCCKQKSH